MVRNLLVSDDRNQTEKGIYCLTKTPGILLVSSMSGSKCSNDILIFCHTFTLSISIPVSALTSSEFVSFSGSSLHMTETGPVQSLSTQSLMFMTPETKTSSLSCFHLPSLLEACLLCLSGCEIIL